MTPIEVFSTEELLLELERRLAPLEELSDDVQSMLFLSACETAGDGDLPVSTLPTDIARRFFDALK